MAVQYNMTAELSCLIFIHRATAAMRRRPRFTKRNCQEPALLPKISPSAEGTSRHRDAARQAGDGAFEEFRKAKAASDIEKAERLRENILAAKASRAPPDGPKIVQMSRRPIDRVVAVRYDLVFVYLQGSGYEVPAAAMRILVLANQKGGVGKTTTAINLGTALAAIGERVLILDLDPQGNASTGLGIDRASRKISTYDVLSGNERLGAVLRETGVPRLFIAPSTLDLVGFELEIAARPDRAFCLKKALDVFAEEQNAASSEERFTYVLVDCPPSLNLLTMNAMAAAHAVIVPLQCEFFALEGLSQLLTTIDEVKNSLNPGLTMHGIVLTMFDSRNTLAAQVVADVRGFMGDKVYETVIPRNVRVSEAPSHGKPVLLYDLKCSGSQAYLKLATEVIQRERGNGAAAGGGGANGQDSPSGLLRAKAKVVVCGPLKQTEF